MFYCARGFAAIFLASAFILATAGPARADLKLDPDPKVLPKARTLATAKADQNFDLPSDKVPFPVRFGICVVQLTAIRDEGRALPLPRAEFDKAIADYRTLAIELKAHSTKITTAAAQPIVDADLAKAGPDTLKFVRENTTALGVTVRKAPKPPALAGQAYPPVIYPSVVKPTAVAPTAAAPAIPAAPASIPEPGTPAG